MIESIRATLCALQVVVVGGGWWQCDLNGIYNTKQFLFRRPGLALTARDALVALSNTSRTPSPVLAEHSK